MRILHVILTPRHSGAEILVRDLARIHVREGHQVGVCAFNPSLDAFKGEIKRSIAMGVKWFLPRYPLQKFSRSQAIRRAVREIKADVVVAHAAIPSIWTRIGLLISSVPVVTVLHDASEDDFSSREFRLLEKFLRYRNKNVVAVSEKALENYLNRFGQARKLLCIKNGIDMEQITEAEARRDSIRRQFGLTNDDRVLLQVGRIMVTKGQRHSLAAAIPLLKADSRLKLWFVGLSQELDYESEIKAIIHDSGVEDQVTLFGGRDDIANLLAASDVFLMPSAQEAHSVAMLEGLASANPCVISKIAVFDFANDFNGVQRVDPQNEGEFTSAIQQCLQQNKRYARDLSSYSIETTSSKYIKLFERC